MSGSPNASNRQGLPDFANRVTLETQRRNLTGPEVHALAAAFRVNWWTKAPWLEEFCSAGRETSGRTNARQARGRAAGGRLSLRTEVGRLPGDRVSQCRRGLYPKP